MFDWGWAIADGATTELLGFAAFGILILGLDDLLMDIAWILTARRRGRLTADIRRTHERSALRLAVLIPAWDESAVIGFMLRHTLTVWRTEDVTIFVGVYPNDPDTQAAVRAVAATDRRVILVVIPPGIMYQMHQQPATFIPAGAAQCLHGS